MAKWLVRLLVLVLPIAVLGYQLFDLERDLDDHTVWRVPITGYDPRDLIRGQYVLFSYDWPINQAEQRNCQGDLADCQLCLERSGEEDPEPAVTVIFGEGATTPAQCDAVIDVWPTGSDAGNAALRPQRFYLDERWGSAFQDLLRQQDSEQDLQMEIAVTTEGRIQALGVILDDQPFDGENRPVTTP